jgi:outer membrane autotransporter protein
MELNTLAAVGYDFRSGGLTAGVFANFQYTNIGFDGFSESGSLVPLTYSNQSQESMRTALGAKASYEFHLGTVIVKPEVRAAWQHEFGDSAYAIDSKFRNAGNSNFTVHGAEIGDDSLLLGAGFAILWNERTSTYIYYDGEIGRSNFDSNNVSGGFRMSF